MDRASAALGLVSELSTAPTVSRAVDAFQRAVEPFGVDLYSTGAVGNAVRGGLHRMRADQIRSDPIRSGPIRDDSIRCATIPSPA